uniref:MPN domain-containing protein n=2 Tax=Macrostomum lignano TaxID=282301 RepID=A0A1I8GVE4_9PLAT
MSQAADATAAAGAAADDSQALPPSLNPGPPPITKVIVHPLVLLSVVDHYNRLEKVSVGHRRCIGVLLGSRQGDVLDISNSFAIPFEEDPRDRSVWFLDHDYLETMFGMFKKVNAKERIVGWYHSGPRLCQNDIGINELIGKFCVSGSPVLVIVSIKETEGLPTEAYTAIEEVHDDGRPPSKTWNHLASEIGAEEAEEVGVEHLLRDIKDSTVGTLSQRIGSQRSGLRGFHAQLKEINAYLEDVISGRLPINHQIAYRLQDTVNLLPDISLPEFVRALYMQTNDQALVIYLSSMLRSILALDDLIDNKLQNRETEKEETDQLQAARAKAAAAAASAAAAPDGKKPAEDQPPSSDKPDSGEKKR